MYFENADFLNSKWKWPAVPGLEKFKNKLHTAAWDDTVDLDDKVIGIIGNGSSAVQIIPAIFPSKLTVSPATITEQGELTRSCTTEIKKMKSFMRSSTWITAGFAQKYAGENGENFDCRLLSTFSRDRRKKLIAPKIPRSRRQISRKIQRSTCNIESLLREN